MTSGDDEITSEEWSRLPYSRPLAKDSASCGHGLETHVVYVRDPDRGDGYRGQVRCRCGKHEVTSPRLRSAYAAAARDAVALEVAVFTGSGPVDARSAAQRSITRASRTSTRSAPRRLAASTDGSSRP